MSERGVYAIDRGIWDHPFFADEPYTEREAFQWLIKEAAWKARERRFGSYVVKLKRGQVVASVRFLAQKWGWHRSKVERYLWRLKTETMIGTHSETGITIITICNYDTYQKVSLPTETPNETPIETGPRQHRDKRESIESIEEDIFSKENIGTNGSKPHKITPLEVLGTVLNKETAKAVLEHRLKKRAPLTVRAAELLAREFRKCADPNAAADAMIAGGWQGFKAEWMKDATGPPAVEEPWQRVLREASASKEGGNDVKG